MTTVAVQQLVLLPAARFYNCNSVTARIATNSKLWQKQECYSYWFYKLQVMTTATVQQILLLQETHYDICNALTNNFATSWRLL